MEGLLYLRRPCRVLLGFSSTFNLAPLDPVLERLIFCYYGLLFSITFDFFKKHYIATLFIWITEFLVSSLILHQGKCLICLTLVPGDLLDAFWLFCLFFCSHTLHCVFDPNNQPLFRSLPSGKWRAILRESWKHQGAPTTSSSCPAYPTSLVLPPHL